MIDEQATLESSAHGTPVNHLGPSQMNLHLGAQAFSMPTTHELKPLGDAAISTKLARVCMPSLERMSALARGSR